MSSPNRMEEVHCQKHAANHYAQRLPDAFGHIDLLRLLGGGEFLSDDRF